ncbi:SH3 domain-containing protein [Oricola sp.]|uniref:SH3 domain-containing protein n=1 Tax=Oricola sp. TaxID=1979950 RepID=UPI003BADBD52
MMGKALRVGVGILAASAFATPAEAATGWTTTAVNMRTCGSTKCPRILTIPARAPVRVHWCGRWCLVDFAGRRGYAYGRYVRTGVYSRPPVVIVPRHRVRPYYRRHPEIYIGPNGFYWRNW